MINNPTGIVNANAESAIKRFFFIVMLAVY